MSLALSALTPLAYNNPLQAVELSLRQLFQSVRAAHQTCFHFFNVPGNFAMGSVAIRMPLRQALRIFHLRRSRRRRLSQMALRVRMVRCPELKLCDVARNLARTLPLAKWAEQAHSLEHCPRGFTTPTPGLRLDGQLSKSSSGLVLRFRRRRRRNQRLQPNGIRQPQLQDSAKRKSVCRQYR